MGKAIDMTGKKFGKLVVIEKDTMVQYKRGDQLRWICLCECGTVKSISGGSLRQGLTKSCGCISREKTIKMNEAKMIDITGDKFGKLTAIKPTERRAGSNIIWECLCECGCTAFVNSNHLRSGDTTSCGCIKSRGEMEIAKILAENNVPFVKEYSFEECRYPDTNYPAKFDFFVNGEYLIEFDGAQHFKECGWTSGGGLSYRQSRDEFKNKWCSENGITLIRIPYTKLKKITLEDLMS